jgi:hypothetical protein
MPKSFLREVTADDVEQAVRAAEAIESCLAEHYPDLELWKRGGLDLNTIGTWAATLLTRPEKAVYVDVEYKMLTNETKQGDETKDA